MATNQRTYYRISDTGTEQVVETILECPINDAVLQRYATEKVVQVLHLFNPALVGPGISSVALSVKGKVHSFTVRLTDLTIRSNFMEKGGLMVPDFSAKTAHSTEFTMKWNPPEDMRMYLMVTVDAVNFAAGESWLLAYDTRGICYRLPTSNTHAEGKICQGNYDKYGGSLLECLIKAYAQFLASPWNDHLLDSARNCAEMATSMFRFKALTDEGFASVEPEKPWISLSQKINSEFVNASICLI